MAELRVPDLTEPDIEELRTLRCNGRRVDNAFLVRFAAHYLAAEAKGVIDPARHFAAHLGVDRQTVMTYMRMARNRSLIAADRP